jgi:hypothetical protein
LIAKKLLHHALRNPVKEAGEWDGGGCSQNNAFVLPILSLPPASDAVGATLLLVVKVVIVIVFVRIVSA